MASTTALLSSGLVEHAFLCPPACAQPLGIHPERDIGAELCDLKVESIKRLLVVAAIERLDPKIEHALCR
jgi:hypothetical protein